MPRSEGFAVMDVSTSVCDDPKFRRLQRESPNLVALAFTAYMATMAESWRAGKRVSIDEAWPAFLHFDQEVCDALSRVGLLDKRGLVSSKAWRSWYEPARKRRDQARDRWARYNAKRDADTTPPPRGNDVGTATSVPLLPSAPSEPSAPSVPPAARGNGDVPKAERERRRKMEHLSESFKSGRLSVLDYEAKRRELVG